MYFDTEIENGLREVKIRSNSDNTVLIFNTAHYVKASPNPINTKDLFGPINIFLGKLSVDKQLAIFNCYKRIYITINDITIPVQTLKKRLATLVGELYAQFTEDELHDWLKHESNISIHSEIRNEPYDSTPPERTYLTDDYRYLMTLSLAMRMMLPVWGQLIPITVATDGGDYKEYGVFELISKSWIAESKSINRLINYLSSSIEGKGTSDNATIGGLSKEELPVYVLAIGVVRRLPIASLSDNIVSNLYNYLILNVLNGLDSGRRIASNLRAKRPEGSKETEGQEGTSRAEELKVKELLSAGDRVPNDIFASRPFDVMHHIDSTVPEDLIIDCLNHAGELLEFPIQSKSHYMRLTQWVVNYNPGTLPGDACETVVAKDNLIKCLALAQATLWHWGFTQLAVLMTAIPDEFITGDVEYPSIKERIDPALVTEGNSIYIHNFTKPVTGDPSKRKDDSTFVLCIDAMWQLIRKYGKWQATCSPLLLKQAGFSETTFTMPKDIKDQIARLLIKIS